MTSSPRVWIVTHQQFEDYQGHNLLARYLGEHSARSAGWTGSLVQRVISKLARKFSQTQHLNPAVGYHVYLVNRLCRRPRSQVGLVHLIWGDDIIDYLDCPERTIVTLHQPYELWSEARWQKIARCAGVICMAERECEEIKRRFPGTSCTFIPHGIDVNFWRPSAEPPPRRICAVGRYMRNFDMLFRVARQLLVRHPDVTIRWLVNPDFQLSPEMARTMPTERFELVRNLSAAELHRFYTESWLFLTPYNNVTASNAIVESMASGTPVFTTRVGGMTSYAGTDAITMVNNNDDAAMLAAVEQCLDSAVVRQTLAARGRRHAEATFDWPRVVSAHETYYATLLGSSSGN